jgi:hypothetical protein
MTTVEDRKKKTAPAPPQARPEAKVVHVPVTDIYCDPDFNARSQANVVCEPDGVVGGSVEELATSLRTKGQDIPVVLRPNTAKKGEKERRKDAKGDLSWWWPPYECVDGARRVFAVRALNLNEKLLEHSKETGLPIIPGVPNGTIAAEIRPLDDREAVLLMGRTSISRNGLEPPDLMTHIVKLTRPPFSMSVQEIAEDQGLAVATVHKYAASGNALLGAILRHWRLGGEFDGITSPKRLNFEELEAVSKERKENQAQAYKLALVGRDEREHTKNWYATAEKQAEKVGATLASWERAGVIRLTSKPWDECAQALVKLPARAKVNAVKVRNKLGEALEAAYTKEKKRDVTKRKEV